MRLNSLRELFSTPVLSSTQPHVLRRYSRFFIAVMAVSTLMSESVYADDSAPLSSQIDLSKSGLDALSESEPTPVKSNIQLLNRPLIAGLWAMTIPNVSCLEYYNYKEDGTFVVKSAGEWSLGKYTYQLPDTDAMATTLPTLTMLIQYDSTVPDCSNNNVDQTGEVQRLYVKWQDSSHIQFCATDDGQQCVLGLRKILP